MHMHAQIRIRNVTFVQQFTIHASNVTLVQDTNLRFCRPSNVRYLNVINFFINNALFYVIYYEHLRYSHLYDYIR